ncbi:MAG: hypothetical protein M1826_006214 [Phylliscum demangeonii]|nr:MAG: hypothetical protein M1826_006214 [Phylliscum demangeonii]
MELTLDKERRVAELAVQRATILTRKVFHNKFKGTVSKDDDSPVTIADFGAQALICYALRRNFPQDEIVGEEEASKLRADQALCSQVWSLVKAASLEEPQEEAILGGPIETADQMLDAIDAGRGEGGPKGRFWTVDPVDGTKGFLRGGQYAICLALIVDGDVKIGVLGCPNLPVDVNAPVSAAVGATKSNSDSAGVLFAASKGSGASSRPLGSSTRDARKISMSPINDITQATFCESVEAGHSSLGDQAAIARQLGITKEGIRIDSQAKYASVARGAADIYLRLPVRKDYQEKIWDHAAGDLIVREAGGEVTDVEGKPLDFGRGRTLAGNRGVIAAPKAVHGRVLDVAKSVLKANEVA